MKSALSTKVLDSNLIVVDSLTTDSYKTKTVVAFLAAVGAGKKNLILNDTADVKFVASAANIPGVKVTLANTLSVYDILNADSFVAAQDAVTKIEEVYAE